MKRISVLVLLTAMLASILLTSCNDVNVDTDTVTNDQPTDTVTDTETDTVTETDTDTEAETEEIIVDDDPVFYTKTERDPIDPNTLEVVNTDWSDTIVNANAKANGVQGSFTDAKRSKFLITNNNSSLL